MSEVTYSVTTDILCTRIINLNAIKIAPRSACDVMRSRRACAYRAAMRDELARDHTHPSSVLTRRPIRRRSPNDSVVHAASIAARRDEAAEEPCGENLGWPWLWAALEALSTCTTRFTSDTDSAFVASV